jgi:hypothetical protein
VSGQLHAPAALPPGKEPPPGTRWIGGWVGLGAGMDDEKKKNLLTVPGLELRPLGRPAPTQSLYRLRYPGSLKSRSKQVKTGFLNMYDLDKLLASNS